MEKLPKELEELAQKFIEDTEGMWCECEDDQDPDWYYVDDNVHPQVKKHHWRCSKCHKITQIG